jgi:hypothetical protein
VTTIYSANTIRDNLILFLDPGTRRSYPNSGTIFYDISGNNNNGSLTDGPVFKNVTSGLRRNLYTYTEQMENAVYYKDKISITQNNTRSPAGDTTADFVYATATSGYHAIAGTYTIAANTTYTFSIFCKANQYTKAHIGEGYNGIFYCTIDLNAGTITATGGAAYISSSITDFPDSWKRISVTFNSSSSFGTVIDIIGYPDNGATLNNYGAQYTGDGSSGIFIWGAQLELGAVMTDYQKITDVYDFIEKGACFNFDGLNDMIRISSPNSKLAWTPSGSGLNNLSIDLWVKSFDGGYYLSKPWNGSGEYNYYLGNTSWVTQINNQSHSLIFSNLATGRWEHICAILTSTQKAVYRNGLINASFTNHNITNNTPGSGNNNLDLCIMSLYPYNVPWAGNVGFSVTGSLGPLKIYNRALSADEIMKNYTSMLRRFRL